MGYNTNRGIYVSNMILHADTEKELESLPFVPMSVDSAYAQADNERGLSSMYQLCAFRSTDGKSETVSHHSGAERPEDFQWTDSYYNNPNLRAILDFFECPIMRARVFRQMPGCKNPMHTDFDRRRPEGDDTLRILIQLSDMPGGAWFRYQTSDSDVSINLRAGQFVVFNADTVAHQTNNLTDRPRDAIMLVVKKNDWIENLVNNEDPCIINLSQEKLLAA